MAEHIPASAAAIGALHAVSDLGSATYDFHANGRTYQVSVSELAGQGPERLLWIRVGRHAASPHGRRGAALPARAEPAGSSSSVCSSAASPTTSTTCSRRCRATSLSRGSGSGTTRRVCRQLEEALRESEIAAELTQQLLAYAGRGRMRTEDLDASDLVRQLGKLMRSSISKKALLAFDLTDDLPPISADATQIRQVVLNLVTNRFGCAGQQRRAHRDPHVHRGCGSKSARERLRRRRAARGHLRRRRGPGLRPRHGRGNADASVRPVSSPPRSAARGSVSPRPSASFASTAARSS